MARTTTRDVCSDDEEWSHVEDQVERRKIQNRNNQRAFRRKRFLQRQADEAAVKPRKHGKALLLPRVPDVGAEQQLRMVTNRAVDFSTHGSNPQLIPAPIPISIHDVSGAPLDIDSRRIFYYASTCLWTNFSQHIIETGESIAAAMTRLSLSDPLNMETFLWTAANELDMHQSYAFNQEVMLKHQTKALARIQQGIEANSITDELIHAIYALVSSGSGPGRFKANEVLLCRHRSPYGDFNPPLASLGSMDCLCLMGFDDRHAEAAARLLEPRGGLRGMETVELAYQMQALDLLRNSKAGSRPMFNLCKSYWQILKLQMPLYRAATSYSQLQWPISQNFQELLLDLRCYLRQVDLYVMGDKPTIPLETLVAWRNINQHRVLSLPEGQDQLFRLAVLIFAYNVTFPVPYRDLVQDWVRELIPLIHLGSDTDESVLWACVIAALSYPEEEVLNCLVEKGWRIRLAMGLASYDDLKEILTTYLWSDSACESGGKRFWKSITKRLRPSEASDFTRFRETDPCSIDMQEPFHDETRMSSDREVSEEA